MKANFFNDFEYYAEIGETLFELETSELFDREVKRYKNTYCVLGKDFVHADNGINPCIKINLPVGGYLIRLTTHHTRPFKGTSEVLMKDGGGGLLFKNTMLPNDILKYEIEINNSKESDLYLTFSSTELDHGLIRVILIVEEISDAKTFNLNLNTSKWFIGDIMFEDKQHVEEIIYDTEYKY